MLLSIPVWGILDQEGALEKTILTFSLLNLQGEFDSLGHLVKMHILFGRSGVELEVLPFFTLDLHSSAKELVHSPLLPLLVDEHSGRWI